MRSSLWTRPTTTSWVRTSSTRRLTYPNVLVGRTFSKAHGLAGMRVGVMIAPPDVLEPIRLVMPLFNLNVVAVQALRAALDGSRVHALVRRAGHRIEGVLYDAFDRLGLRYWKSAANFVLVDGGEPGPGDRSTA